MRLTKHAETRKQQRGFSSLTMNIIQQYGRCENVPGGATKFFFGEREYKRAVEELKNTIKLMEEKKEKNKIQKTIQLMDRAKGGKIITKDGRIITVYK
ncbi:MAG: hypothetical protein GY749_05340 [Desulfobacteraceae bacterium]|nr:hypothetical protein [Desulfobacteraceae bacterium]MCP4350446.1 hypothetical protein [Desulfobacterales bacterium]